MTRVVGNRTDTSSVCIGDTDIACMSGNAKANAVGAAGTSVATPVAKLRSCCIANNDIDTSNGALALAGGNKAPVSNVSLADMLGRSDRLIITSDNRCAMNDSNGIALGIGGGTTKDAPASMIVSNVTDGTTLQRNLGFGTGTTRGASNDTACGTRLKKGVDILNNTTRRGRACGASGVAAAVSGNAVAMGLSGSLATGDLATKSGAISNDMVTANRNKTCLGVGNTSNSLHVNSTDNGFTTLVRGCNDSKATFLGSGRGNSPHLRC